MRCGAVLSIVALGLVTTSTSATSAKVDLTAADPARGRADLKMSMVDGRPTIEAMIDGRGPMHFVVDTGFSGQMAISSEAAGRMGLRPTGTIEVGDPSGNNPMKVDTFTVGDVRLGLLDFHRIAASTLPPRRPSATAIDGVIGLGLLRNLLVTFDYGGGRLRIEHGSLAGAARSVHLSRGTSGIVRMPVTIGARTLVLDLDTGNGRSALFLPAVVIGSLRTRGTARIVGTARTISEEVSISAIELASPVRIAGTRLGVFTVTYPPIAPPGNIGSPAFAGMALQIDIRHSLARVTPSATALPWHVAEG